MQQFDELRRARQRARMIDSGFACLWTHRVLSGNEPMEAAFCVETLEDALARHDGRARQQRHWRG
jgi:hypothetical protein